MAEVDDLAVLVGLGCLTADRSTAEQRALLRVAMRVEAERNATTTANMRARWDSEPCWLVDEVEQSHEPPHGEPVLLSPRDRDKVERRRASFTTERDAALVRGQRP